MFEDAESLSFSGKAVVHLAADSNVISKTGKILLSADLASEYGFTDDDGLIHGNIRSVKANLKRAGWTTTASLVPEFFQIPSWVMHFAAYKF